MIESTPAIHSCYSLALQTNNPLKVETIFATNRMIGGGCYLARPIIVAVNCQPPRANTRHLAHIQTHNGCSIIGSGLDCQLLARICHLCCPTAITGSPLRLPKVIIIGCYFSSLSLTSSMEFTENSRRKSKQSKNWLFQPITWLRVVYSNCNCMS